MIHIWAGVEVADLATLKTRLAEAEEAHHQLMIGRSVTAAGHDDQQVTYTKADAPKLAAYVHRLRNQIARLEGGSTARRMVPAFVD